MEDILSTATAKVFEYVVHTYGEDFVIHVERMLREKDTLLIHHYIFGCVGWREYRSDRWHTQNSFFDEISCEEMVALLQTFPPDTVRITLLSNDLIYSFGFKWHNELPEVTIDLSSAIFGKGTFYGYLVLVLKGSNWIMFSQFERGKVYNRYSGSLLQCLDNFRELEQNMEHPYQWMIDRYPGAYRDATRKKRTFL